MVPIFGLPCIVVLFEPFKKFAQLMDYSPQTLRDVQYVQYVLYSPYATVLYGANNSFDQT